MLRWMFRAIALALCPLCAVVFAGVAYVGGRLPSSFCVGEGQALSLPQSALAVNAYGARATSASSETDYAARVSLFGIIPVEDVLVNVVERDDVAVCGMPFGIKMFTAGVLVVGVGDVDTRAGAKSPAEEAGLRVGDSILEVEGETLETTSQMAAIIENSGGKPLRMVVARQGVTFEATLTPVASLTEKCLKAGLWIRDSAAGIGTLTFYDIASGVFAGLGHPVNDVDTGQTVPISSGEIVPAAIFGVAKGEVGSPGELLGSFLDGSWGLLTTNDETGLYGLLSEQPAAYATLPIAYKQEVTKGAAQLITTIHGDTPKVYDIVIEQVDYREDNPTQNMIIRVTDEELLAETGGVLCGMSGSPIVQNGKLVGAVTHVFVGDPTGGYAIFAENMLTTAHTVPSAQLKSAA